MKYWQSIRFLAALAFSGTVMLLSPLAIAAGDHWSLVPHFGLSVLGDQSADVVGADGIDDGKSSIAVDQGFTAGLSVRYDYADSPWISEFGWEYRSNDSRATTAGGLLLPSGNYASNTFYINGRYVLSSGSRLSTWVGGGVTWLQEVDLDSEDAAGERSFSDSGSVGYQAMVGVDYELSSRFYLTGEFRYSNQTGLDLSEEGGDGSVNGIDYQPVTLGLGVGYRF